MGTPTPHNTATDQIAKVVLMPGDPLRAKFVAETFLSDVICFNTVRNMLGYTGQYKGKSLSVMGSGMGVPSMGIYAFELYNAYGCDAVIRIGTAGGLAAHVKMRDVVIAMSASTDSGFAQQYGYPGILAPTADFGLLRRAVSVTEEKKLHAVVGPVMTSDIFYHAQPDFNQEYGKMGHLALEMETAGLYLTAAYSGKKALSILTITDHLLTGESISARERQETLTDMMEVALETAWHTI